MYLGPEHEDICMIKYFLTNHNQGQIMRVQIYKDGDAANFLKMSAVISAMALLSSLLIF